MQTEPIELGDNVHSSAQVDFLMVNEVLRQAFAALGQGGAINMMTIALMCVGVALGFFIGQTFHISTGTTSTTISSSTTTVKMLLMKLY